MGQLDRLNEFTLYCSSVDGELVSVVSRLPQLQLLDLCSTEAPLPNMGTLTGLSGSLTYLGLVERVSHDSGLQLPHMAAFSNLEQLFIGVCYSHRT